MLDDPIVAVVRRVREELAKQCDFDVDIIFANLRKRQKALGPRLVRRRPGGIMPESGGAVDAQEKARR